MGGLTPREALAILRGLRGSNIVGGDVVEVAPQYDATSNTAHNAAQVLFTILCLVAERRRRGGGLKPHGTASPSILHLQIDSMQWC